MIYGSFGSGYNILPLRSKIVTCNFSIGGKIAQTTGPILPPVAKLPKPLGLTLILTEEKRYFASEASYNFPFG